MKDGLSGDDLAQLLGVSPRTLRNWRRERRGPKCEIVGLQASYPITSLIPWLKKYRPDIDLEPDALLRYRQAKTAERQKGKDPWDEFFEETEKQRQISLAYQDACKLDDEGNYDQADRVLRKAGVSHAIVQQRRDHINWRLANEGVLLARDLKRI